MKENTMELWKDLEHLSIGNRPDFGARALGMMPLFKDLLSKKEGHLSEINEDGVMKDDGAGKLGLDRSLKYHELLKKRGGRVIYKFLHSHSTSSTHIYLWHDGIIEVVVAGTYLNIKGLSHNEKLLQEVKDFTAANWAPPQKAGQIYAIMRQGPHLTLSSLGNAGISLVKVNYTDKVMEDYMYAIRDLQTPAPSGRIVIMEGKPGTGKTHLIRAMLLEVPDAMFVLISPEIITTLAGPELLPLLISHRGSIKGPIVLVLEDADRCLVTRGENNINSIQSLLNLGDGILGSMLDLRIVATTNANKLEMEAAILRPGRLSKRLEVGALDFKTAQIVFRRLLPEKDFPQILQSQHPHVMFEMTLAEVYALARQNGWTPPLRDMNAVDEEEDFIYADDD